GARLSRGRNEGRRCRGRSGGRTGAAGSEPPRRRLEGFQDHVRHPVSRISLTMSGLIRAREGSTGRNIVIPREAIKMRVRLAVLASISVLAASPVLAQAPQVEKNVSMAMAMAIMQGAIDQCTKDGYKVSVVIVDKGGNVAASVRGD